MLSFGHSWENDHSDVPRRDYGDVSIHVTILA